jgi:hypothetical protein
MCVFVCVCVCVIVCINACICDLGCFSSGDSVWPDGCGLGFEGCCGVLKFGGLSLSVSWLSLESWLMNSGTSGGLNSSSEAGLRNSGTPGGASSSLLSVIPSSAKSKFGMKLVCAPQTMS